MTGFTTIEQSIKLIELGLNPKTADMCYIIRRKDCTIPWREAAKDENNVMIYVGDCRSGNLSDYILPCWSLSALLELLPPKIEFLKNEDYFVPQLSRYYDDTNKYICCYDNGAMEHWYIENSPLDAVYNMICWLLENNFINKGE